MESRTNRLMVLDPLSIMSTPATYHEQQPLFQFSPVARVNTALRHKTLDAYKTSRPHRTNSRQSLNGGHRRPNSSFVSSLNKSRINQSVGKKSLLKTEDGRVDNTAFNRHYSSLVTENK